MWGIEFAFESLFTFKFAITHTLCMGVSTQIVFTKLRSLPVVAYIHCVD